MTALSKTVEIDVINDTWPTGTAPPPALVAAAGSSSYPLDVLSCLLFTALWTRPPVSYGFSLSDCWAWLRYVPSIAESSELRLREEWTTLDPHHKTVLSGDFGVGFTTRFLNETLGLTEFSDTLWVVNVLSPGVFELEAPSRRGPRKSPDYIAMDCHGNFTVVECKGTQTSRRNLRDQLDRGRPQKENLRAIGGTTIQHSLVAGLFIPQFENRQDPVIMISDPEWDEIARRLSEFSRDEISRGISQVAYAKELAIFGLSRTANTISRVKNSDETVAAAFGRDRDTEFLGRAFEDGKVNIRRDHTWPVSARVSPELNLRGVRFEGSLSESELEPLLTMSRPDNVGERRRERSDRIQWSISTTDTSCEMKTPSENSLKLTLLEA